jgi:hypothetical protein
MSYCRFGWDGSDVYVFFNSENKFECCGCLLKNNNERGYFVCKTEKQMINHLLKHRKKGHSVPQEAIDRLSEEISEKVKK